MSSRSEQFSLFEAMSAGVMLLGMLFLAIAPFFVTPRFAPMFEEFGTELSWLTRAALAPWTPPLLAIPLILWSAWVHHAREDVVRRRILLASGALLAFIVVGGFLYAVYLPIFELTGNIQAD